MGRRKIIRIDSPAPLSAFTADRPINSGILTSGLRRQAIKQTSAGLLTNSKNTGLIVKAEPLVNISCWPFTTEDIENAKHPNEIPIRDNLTVNIDYKQMGLGGINSWGARPLTQYMLQPNKFSYKFIFRPYEASMGRIDAVARKPLPTIPPAEAGKND